MELCQICNRECKDFKGLSSHISKTHKLKSKDYYDLYLKKDNEGICLVCGKETKFYSLGEGYNKYCSFKCSANSKETRDKYKQTNLRIYGVENVFQNKEIKEKSKNTCLNKYGEENISKTQYFKEQFEKTCLKKYGHKTPLYNKEIKDKIKQTNLEKYGTENPSQNNEVKNKRKKTFLYKYNVNCYFKTDEYKSNIKNNFYNKLLNSDRLKNLVIPLFDLKDYKGINNKYLFKCVKCENEFEDHLDNGRIPRCFNCFPRINSYFSKYEDEIYNFLLTILNNDYIETNNRNILNGLELDLYIPSKNLAIEMNGLYWHSELNGKDKNYHISKTLKCKDKNISLIHIFEDEWIEKQEIVKSIIRSKLGLIDNKIFARKCILKEVNKNESESFLDENHLQGVINGTHIGLYYNNELVSLLTYSKSRFNSNYDVEILRFCSKINTIVIGALSKLIKHINSNSIITYADLRYGDGHSYEKVGFERVGVSNPNYYYLGNNNYINRINRLNFQKHKLESKLEIFDSNLTEWENMQLNGYDRIWDCGCNVYKL